MINVEVHNFQSIEHASICIDGFTALVGRSNLGKSALVRAVKAALTGAMGTAFVRHGAGCARHIKKGKTCECYCSVHLKNDNFDLLWEKGDKRSRYVLNGTEYGVPGRGTPEFLQRPMLQADFGMVKVGEQSKLLQVADQFVDSIFLLDQSGTVTADVFSDVARLDRINVAIRFSEKDRKDAVSTRKVRETDVVTFGRQLIAYDNLDKDLLRVDHAEEGLKQVKTSIIRVSKLGGYIEDLKAIGYRVDLLEKACQVTTPDPNSVVSKLQHCETVNRFTLAAQERAASIRKLMAVESVVEPVVDPVLEASKKYTQLGEWATRLQAIQAIFVRFKSVDEVVVPDPATLRDAQETSKTVVRLASEYEVLTKSIDKLEEGLAAAESEEKTVLQESQAFGYRCPTCNQPLQAKHEHKKVA